jgi:DNA polymerase sigma
MTEKTIKSAFQNAGIVPFNRSIVLDNANNFLTSVNFTTARSHGDGGQAAEKDTNSRGSDDDGRSDKEDDVRVTEVLLRMEAAARPQESAETTGDQNRQAEQIEHESSARTIQEEKTSTPEQPHSQRLFPLTEQGEDKTGHMSPKEADGDSASFLQPTSQPISATPISNPTPQARPSDRLTMEGLQ